MVEQVEREVFEEFEALIEAHPPSELGGGTRAMLLDLYRFFQENADLCAAFLGGNGDMSFFNKLIGLLKERVFEFWLEERKKDPEQFDYFFSYIASGCIGIIREWFSRDMRETPAQMADLTEKLILCGVGSDLPNTKLS